MSSDAPLPGALVSEEQVANASQETVQPSAQETVQPSTQDSQPEPAKAATSEPAEQPTATSESPAHQPGQPQSASDDAPLSQEPATLKLRASLKKRKSQEKVRAELQSKPDPMDLYGTVSLPGTAIGAFPGPTYESAAMTKFVLTENHINFHIFFNDRGLHNHLAHAVLASYGLGASADVIRNIYELQAKTQRPMGPILVDITESNFNDHLGKDDCYAAYLHFFMNYIVQHGVLPTINTWLFARSEHQMLTRAVSGAVHSLIHIGYGLEFNLPAIVAEGLAQAAVHSAMVAPLFPFNWPEVDSGSAGGRSRSASASIARMATRLHLTQQPAYDSFIATARRLAIERPMDPKEGLSAFTVLSYLLTDPDLGPGMTNSYDDGNKLARSLQSSADSIVRWASEWTVESADTFQQCVIKTEEIFFVATVLLGSSAMRPGCEATHTPKLDFFIMHCVTSALFLPTFLEPLSQQNRIAVLRSHWNVMIAYWISRGRPELNLRWLMSRSAQPGPPGEASLAGGVERALADGQASNGKGKNKEGTTTAEPKPASTFSPWPAIIASAADHPDEHVTKSIRSLAFFSSLFGHAPPGRFRSSLQDSEVIDGSVFIRTAGVIMDVMGWSREGHDTGNNWNRSGIGFEQCWQ